MTKEITSSFARSDDEVLETTNSNYSQGVSADVASAPNVILADTTPTTTALVGNQQVTVEISHAANTITNPTFQLGSGASKPIVKNNNKSLVAGDTGGVGYNLQLKYSLSLDSWILMNPLSSGSIPNGGFISMWSGTIASIPSDWSLCDGSNGTPDLRDRFVLSVGAAEEPGSTGGSTDGSTTATDSAGAHTPTGTVAGHTLTVAQIPAHTHSTAIQAGVQDGVGTPGIVSGGSTATDSTGGGGSHSHGLSMANVTAHTHSSVNNFPSYFKLAYIMFTG
ncbi:hypothetical protein KAR91_82425 [Candidatus Pacearchaeota archaeon]|nr:hypothetical protein [Candidatus Pacearchaeota archaeon]